MDDSLAAAIAAFDGATFSDLERVVALGPPSADALAGLVVLLEVGDETAQTAASWILWRFLAAGYPLLPNERRRVVGVLEDATRPACVRLHLCRALPSLRTPPDVAERTCAVLEAHLDGADVAMREASGVALRALADRFPVLRDRVAAALDR